MNVAGLVTALVPVFFVLALGYVAGKRNAFDADQAAGLSKLALNFALPASLFVGMASIKRDLLLHQGPLVLALVLSHAGLFLVAWLALRQVKALRGTPAIIYALMLSTLRLRCLALQSSNRFSVPPVLQRWHSWPSRLI